VQRYDFQFSKVDVRGNYKNLGTILRYGRGTQIGPIEGVGDARQNFTQTYSVTRTVGNNKRGRVLNAAPRNLVAPPNVGQNVTPHYNDSTGKAVSGATSRGGLDRYTFQTTHDIAGGFTIFAGPREDGFYGDTPAIFDLLNDRIRDNNSNDNDGFGQDGNGVDGFKGFNVLHYSIVIPVSQLPGFNYVGALQPAGTGVGVYASVSRPRVTLRTKGLNKTQGPFIQVNRLANPLFNEVFVAMADKDRYNRTAPTSDAALFKKYATNPELAVLVNAVYNTNFAASGRTDLAAIYIPDVLRVNTTTGPTNIAGDANFNRLSFIGGDTIANGAGQQIPAGWPNGRRLGDDVIDIALTALASGPTFSTITVIGDNVAANDATYNRTFPYAATPHSGTRNSKDSGSNVGF
jgi:hypothetical protein